MDVVAIIVMLIAVIALAGVVIYFIYDYTRYKDSTDKSINLNQQRVETEKKDRISNVNNLVGEVNKVHTDMYDSVQSSNMMFKGGLRHLDHKQRNMESGINSVFRFDTPESPYTSFGKSPYNYNNSMSANRQISLTQLPGYNNPNLNLITKVNATMGLTVTDLNKSGNTMQMCAKDDKSRCIQLPDSQGNTILRNLDENGDLILRNNDKGKGIRLDGDVTLNNSINFTPSSQSGSAINNGSLANLMIYSGKVGIGSTNFSSPQATLHVKGTNPINPLLQIDTATGKKIIDVSNNGTVNINSDVNINGRLNNSENISAPNVMALTNAVNNLKQENTSLRNNLNNVQNNLNNNINILKTQNSSLSSDLTEVKKQLNIITSVSTSQVNELKANLNQFNTRFSDLSTQQQALLSAAQQRVQSQLNSPVSAPNSFVPIGQVPATSSPVAPATQNIVNGFLISDNTDCYNAGADIAYIGPNFAAASRSCTTNPSCKGIAKRSSGDHWLLNDASTKVPMQNASCYTKV